MTRTRRGVAARCALAFALFYGTVAVPSATSAARVGQRATAERNDYANAGFMTPLGSGLERFYHGDFKEAQNQFARALAVIPDNTLAMSFLDAAASHRDGALDVVTSGAEDGVAATPTDYIAHVRLGFAYLFQASTGRERTQDAREEFNAALRLAPAAAAPRVGLGIMRANERSSNRAKTELLAALKFDPNDVLAREYLGALYQTDLHDPQRGLAYMIDVPNLVPQYADIQFHIGSVLSDLHEPDAAVAYLKRSIAIDVDHVGEAGQHGYTLLARIYIGERRLDDATKALDLAVASDVDTIYAKTLLAKIRGGDYGAFPAPSTSASPSASARRK